MAEWRLFRRHTWPGWPLRRRILALLAGILLGALVIIALGVALFVAQTERRAWESRQAEVMDQAQREIGDFLQDVEQTLYTLGAIEADYLADHADITAVLMHQNRTILEIVRVDGQGALISNAYRDAPVLAHLFAVNQSDWFRVAAASQPYRGALQLSPPEAPYVIIAVPAADETVSAARVQASMLWDIMATLRFGHTGQAYLIDRDGSILAHPEPMVFWQQIDLADRPEFAAALSASEAGWQGQYPNFAGVTVHGALAPVPGTDWIVVSEVPLAETRATSRLAVLVLGGGMLAFGLVIMGLTAPLLDSLIFAPLARLQAGARALAQGQLNWRLNFESEDEIGRLAADFDHMAAGLEARESELIRARDDALQASRLKSEILSRVSHELRTPLAIILGYAEMLASEHYGPLTEAQAEKVSRIMSSGRGLSEAVEQLLEASRLESGRVQLRPTEFMLLDLAQETEGRFAGLAEECELVLETHFDTDPTGLMCADLSQVEQILNNLVGNALKFTEQGRVDIGFGLTEAYELVLTVTDTGPGIPAEAQSIIFEPFRQADGSTTREKGGIGLGLAIVREAVTLLGGQIYLESETGRGSTFTVILPPARIEERGEPAYEFPSGRPGPDY